MANATITSFRFNNMVFVPVGVIVNDTKVGVSIEIEFPGRKDNPVISGIVMKAESGYTLNAVHFEQDKGHGPFSLSEIHALCCAVLADDKEVKKIYKSLYEMYANA